MTLTAAAQEVLVGAESGALDSIEEPLRAFNELLKGTFGIDDLFSAINIMNQAREAAYAHRRHIVIGIQQLERSASYASQFSRTQASWQLSA